MPRTAAARPLAARACGHENWDALLAAYDDARAAVRADIAFEADRHVGLKDAVVAALRGVLGVVDRRVFVAQADASRFGGEKRVGSAFDDEPVDPLGDDLAPEPVFRFEQGDADLRGIAHEAMRGGKSGDAAADDDYVGTH